MKEGKERSSRRHCQSVKSALVRKKSLCKGMTELLRNSKHEEEARRYQQLVVSSYSHVYLETMETAEDEEAKPYSIRHTRILCMLGGV